MNSTLKLARELFRNGFDPTSIVTYLELRRALKGCDSVLDVGCGPASAVRHFGFKHLTGLEFFLPDLEKALYNRTHHEFIHGDVRNLDRLLPGKQVDASVALDVIEHLKKEEGHKFIKDLERISTKRIALLTPNGFLPQGNAERGDLQAHYSGWSADEMKSLGFDVTGILGPKRMRGEYHRLKWKPKFLWGIVSLVAHFVWTRWRPSSAAAILCVKTLKG
ncbi:MAG TPA: class I SAM-dependent methyltransferase [Verrucomicrobiota bacterium]|nr:class I SAM-dependent methyltransferase [Verrucomicrobiota bacterium]